MKSHCLCFGLMSLLGLSWGINAAPPPAPLPSTRLDGLGDPLPDHASARLGTIRFRHGGAITALAVSADGKYLASGGQDRLVQVWQADNGKLLRSIRCESPYTASITFSPDGRRIVTNIDSDNISIFEWATTKEPLQVKATLIPALDPIASLIVWSPDGSYIGCAVADEEAVLIVDAASGKEKHRFKKAQRVAFSGNGKSIAVAEADGSIKVLTLDDFTLQGTLKRKEASGPITDLRFLKGDQALVAVHEAGSIAVWDVAKREIVRTIAAAGPIAVVPGGQGIAAVERGRIAVIDLKSGEKSRTAVSAEAGSPFVYSPDGNRLFVAGPGSRVHVWNLTGAKEELIGEGHQSEVLGLAFSKDGKSLLSAGADGLRLWDVVGRQERAAARRSLAADGLFMAPDGRRFVAVDPKTLGIWEPVDLANEKPFPAAASHILESPSEHRKVAAFTPDGTRLVHTDGETKLAVVDPARGTKLPPPIALSGIPLAAAFAPNGRSLLVLTRNGLLHQLSVGQRPNGDEPKDTELWRKRVQRSQHGAVAYSPNGLIAAASSAGRIVLLDSISGRQWQGLYRQLGDGEIRTFAFSPDGRLIAAGHDGSDGLVRIWEVLTGKEIVTFRGHAGAVNAVAFNPRGNQVASAGADSTILFWDLTLPPGQESKLMTFAEAWEVLDSENTRLAYEAMGTLQRQGATCVEPIRAGLKGAVENQARIQKLIHQLDDDEFRVRRAARLALDKEGLRAMPALNAALRQKQQPEAERLLHLLVEGMEQRGLHVPEGGLFGESLRTARAIQILESIGDPKAIEVLEALAKGEKDERLSGEAKAALERLRK